LSAASRVLVGTAPPEVAAESSAVQGPMLPAPVHDVSALASEFNFAVGTASVGGRFAPGEVPVTGFTSSLAVAKALSRPVVLVQLAPTFPPLDRNGASAHADATVVTSLTMNELPAEILLQGPRAAMSQREELAAEVEAGWPPLESK